VVPVGLVGGDPLGRHASVELEVALLNLLPQVARSGNEQVPGTS